MADKAVGDQLAEILDQYSEEIKKDAKEAIEKTAKETVQRLKSTSPRRMRGRKHYANGWKAKADGTGYVVYNATKPRLTHLLEKGHAIANQHGSLPGRVPAQPHIAPAEDWAADEVVRKIEERLNRL